MARNPQQADELVSESMVVLQDLSRTYDPVTHKDSSFSGYIAWYGKRRLIDWLRSRDGRAGTKRNAMSQRDSVPISDEYTDKNSYTFVSHEPLPEKVAEDRETLREASHFIHHKLSPRQRAAILSHTDEDEAVAKQWDMSVATLQTHRSHARTRLREALRRNGWIG